MDFGQRGRLPALTRCPYRVTLLHGCGEAVTCATPAGIHHPVRAGVPKAGSGHLCALPASLGYRQRQRDVGAAPGAGAAAGGGGARPTRPGGMESQEAFKRGLESYSAEAVELLAQRSLCLIARGQHYLLHPHVPQH